MMSTDQQEKNAIVRTPASENFAASHQLPKDFTAPRRLFTEDYVVQNQNISPQEDSIATAESRKFTDSRTNPLSIDTRQPREDGSQFSEERSRDYTKITDVTQL